MEFRFVTSSVTPLVLPTDCIRCYKFGRSAGPCMFFCSKSVGLDDFVTEHITHSL